MGLAGHLPVKFEAPRPCLPAGPEPSMVQGRQASRQDGIGATGQVRFSEQLSHCPPFCKVSSEVPILLRDTTFTIRLSYSICYNTKRFVIRLRKRPRVLPVDKCVSHASTLHVLKLVASADFASGGQPSEALA